MVRKAPPVSPVEAYIAGFPPKARRVLQRLRTVIRKAAPGAHEAMKYGIPTFALNENLVHFAAYERHIGFYPTPDAIRAFAARLKPYPCSKGAVQFPLDRPIPYDLVAEIVAYRVASVTSRA